VSDYLADTTVLIDYLKGRSHVQERVDRLDKAGHRLCCCDVTICELYTGMRPHERPRTERFLGGLSYLATSRAIAERAGAWCHEHRQTGVTLGLADALIAATALAHGAILLTANTRHFPFPDLVVEEVPSHAGDGGPGAPDGSS
jgi:predicted nucleic acid-binding protein